MKTQLKEAMASGVFVEFRDARGHTLGQVIYTNWRGRPVPAVGDDLNCTLRRTAARPNCKVRGKVISRQFDVQHDERGDPCVWVILVAEAAAAANSAPCELAQLELIQGEFKRTGASRFSDN